MSTTIVRDFTQPVPAGQTNNGTVVSITETSASPHSIEVNKNAKGEYSYSVKIYFGQGEEGDTISKVERIYAELDARFNSTPKAV